ncbi:MAG: DUF4143 domain-containing protein [Candidatus Omnitrophota bacterium]
MTVKEEILNKDALMTQFKNGELRTQEDVENLVKKIMGKILETVLKGELDAHLGYERYDHCKKETTNRRNGSSSKKVKTNVGKIEFKVGQTRVSARVCDGVVNFRVDTNCPCDESYIDILTKMEYTPKKLNYLGVHSEMEEFKRLLTIDLPNKQSAFLWGPRKTGKSFFLKKSFPNSLVYDFLKTDLFLEISKNPSHIRQQLLAQKKELLLHPIILDEVQKIPQVLDEVHWMIENTDMRFILCGSSARKLKRGHANLLGGRAWRYEMFPLTSKEIAETGEIDLLRILNRGMIPVHYLQDFYQKSLFAYIKDYLKEEIFNEGLTRNIPAFSRFFDAMGYSHGQLTNYSNIARDCGVDAKTVKEYYQILIDTLLGTMIEPFKRKQHRQVINKASKFYLFDVGVAGAIIKRSIAEEKGEHFGQAFEHFILMEMLAHRSYTELNYDIHFWRTKTGLEVDFILGNGETAIEVKGTDRLDPRELKPLQEFIDEFSPANALVVCNETVKRVCRGITIMPWREFLSDLWSGKIIH